MSANVQLRPKPERWKVTTAWIIAALSIGILLPWAIAVQRGRPATAIFLMSFFSPIFFFLSWPVALVLALSNKGSAIESIALDAADRLP